MLSPNEQLVKSLESAPHFILTGGSIQGAGPYPAIAGKLRVSLQELLTGEPPASQIQALQILNAAFFELEKLKQAIIEMK
jgi:hypothetical protein